MPLVVGLRNPGPGYEGTRHNAGGDVVAVLAERHGGKFKKARLGIRADVAEVRVGGDKVVLARNRTFMNESGQAIAPLLRYYRSAPADVLVVHDDIDLPFGRLRMQEGGGTGGHNGVASLVKSFGTPGFWRLKFGVGRPPGRMDPADFVLKRFRGEEQPEVDLVVQIAADVIELYLADGPETARQKAGELTAT